MSKKEEIVAEVYDDKTFKTLLRDMPEHEKKRIDASLKAFVDAFAVPFVETFEQVAKDESVIEELKRQLAKPRDGLVKG